MPHCSMLEVEFHTKRAELLREARSFFIEEQTFIKDFTKFQLMGFQSPFNCDISKAERFLSTHNDRVAAMLGLE